MRTGASKLAWLVALFCVVVASCGLSGCDSNKGLGARFEGSGGSLTAGTTTLGTGGIAGTTVAVGGNAFPETIAAAGGGGANLGTATGTGLQGSGGAGVAPVGGVGEGGKTASAGGGASGGASASGGFGAGGNRDAGALLDSAAGTGSGGSGAGGTSAAGGAAGATGGTSGVVDAALPPTDFTRFIGKYKVGILGGGITCGSYAAAVQFSGASLEIVRGTDSDLVVTSNPLPGEFPGSCTFKVNAVDSPYSDLVEVARGVTCTSGAATLTIGATGAYNFAYTRVDGKLIVSASMASTGGTHGSCNFGYSAEAVPAP